MNAQARTEAKRLGGLTPEAALEFLKSTPDAVIVEVNTDYWKLKTPFIGALHILHDQMADRYNVFPRGRPVILHCGAGVVSVPAHEALSEKRPVISALGYWGVMLTEPVIWVLYAATLAVVYATRGSQKERK